MTPRTSADILKELVGFASVSVSVDAVNWGGLVPIVSSWVVTPFISGLVAFGLFMSVQWLIIDTEDPFRNANPQQQFFQMQNSPRAVFLSKFANTDKRTESETSILQALYMMNNKFLADATSLENNKTLATIADSNTSIARKVRTLYLVTLARPPRPDEESRVTRYVESGGARGDQRSAMADIFWVLLNSTEFRLNH